MVYIRTNMYLLKNIIERLVVWQIGNQTCMHRMWENAWLLFIRQLLHRSIKQTTTTTDDKERKMLPMWRCKENKSHNGSRIVQMSYMRGVSMIGSVWCNDYRMHNNWGTALQLMLRPFYDDDTVWPIQSALQLDDLSGHSHNAQFTGGLTLATNDTNPNFMQTILQWSSWA